MFIRIINFSGAQVPRKPKFTRAWVREADRASRDIVSVLKTLQRRTRQPSCSQWGSPSGALWCGRPVEPLHSAESSARLKPIANRGVDNNSARPERWLFSLISSLLSAFLFARCVIIACIVHHAIIQSRKMRVGESRRMAAFAIENALQRKQILGALHSLLPCLFYPCYHFYCFPVGRLSSLSALSPRLSPCSQRLPRRIASRSIFCTLRTWRAPWGPS